MILKFFKWQWNYPVKGDWSLAVKKDLSDFEIESDFDWIKSKSRGWFKKYVNEKTRVYTFKFLTKIQNTHSKLKNICYQDFKLQSYFFNENLDIKTIRNVFKFRTRMLEFGQNFKGYRLEVPCPLGCLNSNDCQTHLFSCEKVVNNIQFTPANEYVQLYKEEIPTEICNTLTKLLNIRCQLLSEIFVC